MAARLAMLAGLDETWRDAFATVPREAFLPETVWRNTGGRPVRVERGQDADAWWEMVYDERRSIVTQLDDGADDGPGHYTSSSTMPLVMAQMLVALAPRTRRVLEIGTGTGYNAALLAHRYGARNVVTVEVDREVAERADEASREAGYPVTVVCGDGAAGAPGVGEFDAVIATCAVRRLPAAWIEQCPRGRIVAPFATRWSDVACLVLDTVGDRTAVGRFYPGFVFMDLRAQRPPHDRPATTEGGRERMTQLAPAEVTWSQTNAAFVIGLLLPGVDYRKDEADGSMLLMAWDGEGSWALVGRDRGDGAGWPVREAGPRSLWHEVEAAYVRWLRWLRPSPDRFGATVTADRAWVWLDEPGNAVADLPT